MRALLRVSILVFAVMLTAAYIQPQSTTVEGGVGADIDFVFTVVNDDPRPLSATFEVDEFSAYLEDSVTLSATTLALRPSESMNVQVRGRVPALGPEEHLLTYHLVENGVRQGSFTIRIPVQGTPRIHPGIDVSVSDAVRQEPVSALASLSNFGNVIAYYNLTLAIRQEANTIGEVAYPTIVQVLPGDQQEIGLLYTDRLEPGEYLVELRARVNNEQEVSATVPFRVLLEDQTKRVSQGDDLVLTLTGTGDAQSISYTISSQNREIIRDVAIATNNTVTIPTAELAPGNYAVAVTVEHARGTDVTRIMLEVTSRNIVTTSVIVLILVGSLLSLLFTRTARTHIRIAILSWKLRREEKRLKRLIEKTHQIL